MGIEIPKIEPRNFDDLLREFKSLVPFYTPEWRLEIEEKGPGIALVKIFIHFLRIIYHRLNRLPEKHFISFLDRIGIKLIPAQSALVPITFLLSKGAADHILVPQRTQVAAGEVIFETENNLLSSPARLIDIYSVDGPKDAVFPCPPNIISGEPVLPVETKLLHPAAKGKKDIFVQSFEDLLAGDIIRIGEPPGTEGAGEDCEYGIIDAVEESHVTLTHPLDKGEPGYYRFPAIAVRGVGKEFYKRLRLRHRLKIETVYLVEEEKLIETERRDFTIKHLLQYLGKENNLAMMLHPAPYFQVIPGVQVISGIPVIPGIFTAKELQFYEKKVEEIGATLKEEEKEEYKQPFEYYREWAENILENAEKCVLDMDYEEALELAAVSGEFPGLSMVAREAGEPVEKITHLELFAGKNLQEHIFYLGHSELFNIECDAVIVLQIATSFQWSADFGNQAGIQWEYWGEAVETRPAGEEENIGWHPLRFQTGEAAPGEFYLRKDLTGEIQELAVNGVTSRWIRCKIKDINAVKDIELKNIRVRVVPIRFLELPTEAIRGIEETFSQRLAEKGIYTVEQLLEFKDRVYDVARVITSTTEWKERAENIIENTMKHLLDEEYEDMLIKTGPSPELLPDMACFNDQVYDLSASGNLSLESPIHPLGKQPALQDTFYVSSKEIFSEPESKIHIKLQFSSGSGEGKEVKLSWEYWDGETWNVIKNLKDTTGNFAQNGEVSFPRPGDMAATSINGKENYWVRVRLVSGDYGREKLKETTTTVTSTTETGEIKETTVTVYVPDYSDVRPPIIEKLTLSYTHEFTPKFYTFDCCLAANNLDFIDRTKESRDPGKSFKPFVPLEEQGRGFYLAFDKKLKKGPIALFFVIDEQPVLPEQIPLIRWEYYNEEQQWERLDVLDSTMSLTQTGVMEFVFPTDFREARKFGRKAYWIRALYGDKTAAGSSDIAIPTLTGIFLNTTWARQCETITGEIVGSSDGTSGQTFCLKKIPVISDSEDIWIDEFKTISAEEQTQIKEEDLYQVREVLDNEGKLTGFWVKWEPIESILNASADDRSYEIDNVSGELTFGNGIYGKIPPTGADNIKADYRSGGGKHGNLPAYEVKELKTSLPFLDKAFNPLAAGAGTDTETIEQLMVRGPYLVKHRNRAVTVEDFEKLAFQCSPGIARVKCLPNMNERREPQNGSVTVIVIPRTEEEKPVLSLLLQQKVEQCLQAHAAYTLVEPGHLKVIGPIYVEVSLEAAVAATSVHVVPLVENDCISRLKQFLNPLTGGYEQEGWEFGKIPCFSDFYALLEKIEGVDHVEDLSVKLRLEGDSSIEVQLSPDNPELGEDFRMPVYALVCSGKHKVEVSW